VWGVLKLLVQGLRNVLGKLIGQNNINYWRERRIGYNINISNQEQYMPFHILCHFF